MTLELELTQLNVAVHRQKDVIGLNITMNDTLRVQVLQTIQGLEQGVRSYICEKTNGKQNIPLGKLPQSVLHS